MKKINAFLLLALLVAGFVCVPFDAVRASTVRLVLVVAKGSPVKDLSMNELKRLFMSESVVVSGVKLIPFNYLPGTAERTTFDHVLFGLSPDQVARLWIDRRVRGQLPAPRAIPSLSYMIKIVEVFPNAIGYAPEDKLTSLVQPVRIGGVSHQEPGYNLHAP